MATGRMLRRSVSLSEQVAALSLRAALIYTWMIPHADDFGRLHGSPRRVRAEVLPLRDDITVDEVGAALTEMARVGLIHWYEVNGELYVQHPNWDEHQTGLHKRTRSRLPPPNEGRNVEVGKFQEILGNSSPTEQNRTELKGTEQKRTVRKRSDYDAEFEAFWTVYPRRIAKAPAYRAWGATIKVGRDPAILIDCATRYAASVVTSEERFIMHPSTFLNQERWRDYLEDRPQHKRKSRAAASLASWMEGMPNDPD